MDREFECRAQVLYRGQELHLNKIIARFDLEEIMPPRDAISDPFDLHRVQETAERRRRFIDMLASEFAHSLTEALFKQARSP